jgi:hypothetical protein
MSVDLANQLFVAPDRLGWEYREPVVPRPFPQPAPPWVEPSVPDTREWERQRAAAVHKALGRSVRSFFIVVVCAMVGSFVLPLGLGATAAWIGLPIMVPSSRINQAQHRYRALRRQLHARFDQNQAQWRQQASLHDAREHERFDSEMLWYPLHLLRQPGRVDVFGGTGHGWASLIVTLGSSSLATGNDITVLDLSDQQVGLELAELTRGRGEPVAVVELPRDGSRLDLLRGVDPDDLPDLLADAVQVVRRTSDDAGQRSLDIELIDAVVSRFDAPATFGRVVAGLRVLRRMHDVETDGQLSAGEVRALTAQVDMVGRTDRVQDELQFLTSSLELLTKDAGSAGGDDVGADQPVADAATLLGSKGLCVVSTSSSQRRRKDVLDGVVFHRVLAELRAASGRAGPRVLCVAGADRLGLDSLEELTDQARRLGLRLVLLFEHLRGDLKDLVGGADSTTVFMRLGNFGEADAAAQQIGRGQKFVLSQLTQQIGNTLTTGASDSDGEQEGFSTSQTSGGGSSRQGLRGSRQRNWSSSASTNRSTSWQKTTSTSQAHAQTDGVTVGRVHEFIVEPTQIQDLPHTAFVMTASGGSSRRIVLGDCNPGISLLPRVAAQPLQLPVP